MELLEIIKGRRAVRNFSDKDIPFENLMKILESAIWAPSGSNIQAWEFILVAQKENIEKIKLISPGLYGNPAAIIIVCINTERAKKGGKEGIETAKMDISMASQNMMLMAYSLGIGSCPILSFNKIALKEIFEIPDYIDPQLILIFGYTERWPLPPKRRPIKEVVHIERFGNHIEE